jgi:cytochrome c-type biogenesis protein CcmE
MKILQKLILPLLLLLIIFIIYKFYFAKTGLGSFDDFDPNNNAVKEIRVHLLVDRGIEQQGGAATFYVADKNGKEVLVNGEVSLPTGFEKADIIILMGHLSGSNFHVHEVLLD